jgi:hypothetical protein
MTAVMRSIGPTTAAKVLRVGRVECGRLVEERVLQQRTSVTVGPTEEAMFVVEATVPARFKLFEPIGDAYYLNTIDGMTGRLALATGIADLVTLRTQMAGTGPIRSIRITEEVRGKVVLGGTTFLFQFVTPRPLQPKPRLPLSVKDGVASQIDWTLTVIAAFSFLLHFGVIGAMYSDWMDTVVDDDITVGLVHAIAPTQAPVAETNDETVQGASTAAEPAVSPSAEPKASSVRTNRRPGASPDTTLDALLSELNRANFAVIGSVNGGPNLREVMTSSDHGAPVDLDELGQRQARIGDASGVGLDLPTGGPIEPRRSDFGLPTRETGKAPSGAGQPTRVVPLPDVHAASPVLSAPMPDAEAVIRKQIQPGARRCYQKGLDSDPTQSGRLVVVIRVSPSGEVESASIDSNTGLSETVAQCVASVARRAKFDRTGPGGATIAVPFAFLRQGR